MPTVCCGSERCKLATKMRNVIRKLFYCGAISLLVGPWVFASLPEESFLSMLLSAAVYMVWGWLFIFCGFAMIAPSSIWKCKVSDNHGRAFIEGEVSSSSLVSWQLHRYRNSRKNIEIPKFSSFIVLYCVIGVTRATKTFQDLSAPHSLSNNPSNI